MNFMIFAFVTYYIIWYTVTYSSNKPVGKPVCHMDIDRNNYKKIIINMHLNMLYFYFIMYLIH